MAPREGDSSALAAHQLAPLLKGKLCQGEPACQSAQACWRNGSVRLAVLSCDDRFMLQV